MKNTDIIQPQPMNTIFAEDVYSASGTTDFEIPAATSTAATDTCVIDDGFLPITSEALPPDGTGIAPERKNFNGLFYLSTDQRVFLQNGGVITYDSNVATKIGGYPLGAILGYVDASGNYNFVKSLKNDNQVNFVSDPTKIDGVNWEYVNSTLTKNISNTKTITLTGAVTGSNTINLGSSNSISIATTQNQSLFDGEWTYLTSPRTILSNNELGGYSVKNTIASYLPNDNSDYMVQLFVEMESKSNLATTIEFGYTTYPFRVHIADAYYTNYEQPSSTNVIWRFDRSKNFYIYVTSHKPTSLKISLYSYRRLGTNS